MDQLSVEGKIQIENKIQDIIAELLVWWWRLFWYLQLVNYKCMEQPTFLCRYCPFSQLI